MNTRLTMLLLLIALIGMVAMLARYSVAAQAPSQIQSSATSIISGIIAGILQILGSIFSSVSRSFAQPSNYTSAQPVIEYAIAGYPGGSVNLTTYQHSNPITLTITKRDNSTSDRNFTINLTTNSKYLVFTDLHNNQITGCGPYTINVLNQSNGQICQFELYALAAPQGGNYTVYTASATVYYNGTVANNIYQGSGPNPFEWKVTVSNKKQS